MQAGSGMSDKDVQTFGNYKLHFSLSDFHSVADALCDISIGLYSRLHASSRWIAQRYNIKWKATSIALRKWAGSTANVLFKREVVCSIIECNVKF